MINFEHEARQVFPNLLPLFISELVVQPVVGPGQSGSIDAEAISAQFCLRNFSHRQCPSPGKMQVLPFAADDVGQSRVRHKRPAFFQHDLTPGSGWNLCRRRPISIPVHPIEQPLGIEPMRALRKSNQPFPAVTIEMQARMS